MKRLFLLFAVISLIGCMSQRNIIHEDTMYVTRKYIGDFDTLVITKIRRSNYTMVFTDQARFSLLGMPELGVKKNNRCYLRYIPETLPGSHSKIWVLYFTWDGTSDFYKLHQNPITGQVY